jgi:signal transduction histidine kinase
MASEKNLELQIQQLKAEVQIAHQKLQEEIDKRCLAEKKMLREQYFIQQIIDTIPGLIFVNSLDGELLLQNQAASRIYESTNKDFNSTNQTKFERIIQSNDEFTLIAEETFILPTGECRNFQVARTVILLNDDDKKYYLTICNDITANKLPERIDFINNEGNNKARQIISTFITTTSHEFRTPLTTILGSTELLMFYSNSWSEDKINKYLNRIEDSVKHMMVMLDNLLFLENEI